MIQHPARRIGAWFHFSSAVTILLVSAHAVHAARCSWIAARSELQHTGIRLREDIQDARSRVLGAAYTEAILRIQSAIPPGATYLLGRRGDGDAQSWVRYDLLPRRPVWAGVLRREDPDPSAFFLPDSTPVVLCSVQEEAPVLTTWGDYRKEIENARR